MNLPTIGIQASLQIGPMDQFGSAGPQSADFMAAFRRHHHHHHHHHQDCGQSGGPGQQDQQLGQIGQQLVQAGQQLVQEGQKLMQQGDFQQGMQLIREGARLEQQGARLETQGASGADPCNQGGSCNPMGGQDPMNGQPMNGQPMNGQPMNGQYGSQSPSGPNSCGGNDFGGGYGQNCGCGQLSVNSGDNSVNTGRYTIKASKDNGGTLTVTDNMTGENFKVWGDPHVSTGDGDSTDFQHAPATFNLPDGTKITVTPTNGSGANTIDHVTITKGNDAATMSGFKDGNLQTQHMQGQGRSLDASTPDGTELHAKCGNINNLVLPDGTEIKGNNIKNIDSYANNSSQSLGQLQQTIAQLEQEIRQIEQGLNMSSFMSTGFANFGAMFA